ncbi:hypothetical protein BJV74DRAFT_950131 [Russula compacta]|nr:hypothetical protein BJV74DRAFT_950131 [Russula compacta]
MSDSDCASRAVNIGSTYGATFVGLILSAVLYGMTMIQIWIYFWSRDCREKDSTFLKALVALLLILDTVHTAFCICALYWYLIQNFGNVDNLNIDMWAMEAQIDINSSLAVIIQLFYARRLHLLSKRAIIPAIIVVVAVISYASGYVFSLREQLFKLYSRDGSLKWVTSVGMGGSTFVDFLITGSMCWCLYNKRAGFARTDSIVATLMIYSVNTGLLTSFLATASLISFLVSPNPLISKAFYLPLGKCYVNSLLALLNNRRLIRQRMESTPTELVHGRVCHWLKRGSITMPTAPHQLSALEFTTGGQHEPDTVVSITELKTLEATSTAIGREEARSIV